MDRTTSVAPWRSPSGQIDAIYRVHAFPLHSIQFSFQSQRLCDTSCHVEAHVGVAKGAGEGGDDGGGVGGGSGYDDADDADDNDDVVDETAIQLSRSQLEQHECKTFFILTLLIKTSLRGDKIVVLRW
nr:hypothetical protein HmN_000246100 [Hymenolepis microstoma]